MTKTTRLEGFAAIEYAEANDLPLCKYEDPTEDAREDVTPDEARKVASEDARLIYIDVVPARYQVRALGEATLAGGRHYEYSVGQLLGSTDDAAAAKRIAETHAGAYSFGTAIVDTEERTVDVGGAIVSASDVYAVEVL